MKIQRRTSNLKVKPERATGVECSAMVERDVARNLAFYATLGRKRNKRTSRSRTPTTELLAALERQATRINTLEAGRPGWTSARGSSDAIYSNRQGRA